MATATQTLARFRPEVPAARYRGLSLHGILARATVALLIATGVLVIPLFTGPAWDHNIGLAAIYGVIGLSVNIITGHAGQISLGHQAFVGVGAFMAAYMIAHVPEVGFAGVMLGSALTGAVMALILGLVALRIRGLYLALVTLAFGLMAETSIFNLRAFTRGGAGLEAPRPLALQSEQVFTYFAFAVLAVFLFLDWRLIKSKAGRAIVALRNNEQVAATLGINVTGYKLLAFVLGGFAAGTAGGLFAHWNTFVQALDFQLQQALVWVLMAVVGGLGSRAGVLIGASFFALFPFLLDQFVATDIGTIPIPFLDEDPLAAIFTPLIGAFLLLLTITLYPGGIGQQLLPIRRWLAGGPFGEPGHRRRHRRGRGQGDEGEAPPAGSSEPTVEIARAESSRPEPTIQMGAAAPDGPAASPAEAAEVAQVAQVAEAADLPGGAPGSIGGGA